MNTAQKTVTAVLVVLVIILAGTTATLYRKFSDLQKNPQKTAQDTINKLLADVGALIVLPTGETPTVATVSDPAKLKDQPFFAKAQVGDKVLIYTTARKAILYSPMRDIILEVAPISIGNNQAAAPTKPAATEPAAATGTNQ